VTYNANFESFRAACQFATEFYIEQRYPVPESPPPSRKRLEEVVQAIQRMITLILRETQ